MSDDNLVLRLPSAAIELVRGDITKIPVDAIVNAANSALAGGGGVDGAIHRAGGPRLIAELAAIRSRQGSCPPGSAVVTTAGNLPARYVFHTVGPIYADGSRGEADVLASCYRTCLDLAREHHATSISFPSISTGVYGYPVTDAARIALSTVRSWLLAHPGPVSVVKLVQFSDDDHKTYARLAAKLDP